MKSIGKLHLVLSELHDLHLDIVGVSKVRWSGGHFESSKNKIVYSSSNNGQGGVAIVLLECTRNSLESYNVVSERIMVAK